MDGTSGPQAPRLKRRRFTSADVRRMVKAGVLQDKERLELIGGELIEMAFEGETHWRAKQAIISWLLRRLPPDVDLAPDGPLRLDEDQEPEPDFFLFATATPVNDVRGGDVLLVCEIADSSLAKDRAVKAPLYSVYGVRLYWIVDVINRVTFVHTLDSGVYGEPAIIPFDAALTAPGVSEPLVLSDLLGP